MEAKLRDHPPVEAMALGAGTRIHIMASGSESLRGRGSSPRTHTHGRDISKLQPQASDVTQGRVRAGLGLQPRSQNRGHTNQCGRGPHCSISP